MPDRHDADALTDAWGTRPAGTALDPEGRVLLLGRVFRALLRGEMPDVEARLFVAGGGMAWLENGGDLLRDYWKVKSCRGSHDTPAKLWRRAAHRDEGQDADDGIDSASSSTSPAGDNDATQP